MRAVRVLLLLVLVLAVSLASAAAAPSTGLLGLTPAQVLARLGSNTPGATYWPPKAATPIFMYCVGGTFRSRGYDPYEMKWINSPISRPFPGATYGPCARSDPARRETFLVRYERGRVVAVGYITAFGSARDEGWLGALHRIASGLDPDRTEGTRIRYPDAGTEPPPWIADILGYPGGRTFVSLVGRDPGGTVATIWYGPPIRITAAHPFASPEPLLGLFQVLANRYSQVR